MPSEMLWLLLPLLWAGSLAQNEEYSLKVQTPVTVQEGLCVQVACEVSYPRYGWDDSTPAHGYWFREQAYARAVLVATNNPSHKVQEETQGRFHLRGDPRSYNCSLDIRDARRTDNRSYFFRLERGGSKFTYMKNKLSVHVTAFNHTPHILIPGNLESGSPKNLTCSVPWACKWGTPPIFSWTSAAHSSLGPRTRLSSVLTLTPRPQDHGTNLTCQVHFPATGVTVERTIHLNVTYPRQNPTPGGCLGDGTGHAPGSGIAESNGLSGPGAEVMLVAIAEAAVKTLVLLTCLLVLIGRYHKRKAPRPNGGIKDADTGSG